MEQGCNDAQYNDIQQNDIQSNAPRRRHNNIQRDTKKV